VVVRFYLACLLYIGLPRLSASPYNNDPVIQQCSSSTSTSNYAVVPKYGKVLTQKINASIYGFNIKKNSLMEDKIQGAEGAHSSEPEKAHLTGKFVATKMVVVHCLVWALCLQL